MLRRLAPVLLLCACLLAACGKGQEPAPEVFAVKAPHGAKKTVFKDAGITLKRPANWKLRRRDPPGVFEILSGEALVACWAYPREEPLPESKEQLTSATKRLVDAIVERDPNYKVESAKPSEVAGSLAIDVSGEQVISKRRLRTHSVHVFEGDVEYVFEALAPPQSFGRTEAVLEQLLGGADLTGELSKGRTG